MGYEDEVGDVVRQDLTRWLAREDERLREERALEETARDLADEALQGYAGALTESEADDALVELVADALQDDVCDARAAFRELMRLLDGYDASTGRRAREVAEAAAVLRERLLEAAPDVLADRARHQLAVEREEAAVADAEARGLVP